MKLRSFTLASLGILVAVTVACGSNDRETTTPAASETLITAPSETTTTSPAGDMSAADDETAADAPATTAAAPDQPATGTLGSSVPTQTMTTLPENSFTVTFDGTTYYCEPHGYDDERNDCIRYYGGAAPYVGTPELYCSYSMRPECSEDWYPAELEDADLITMSGQTYVCRSAVLGRAYDDKDCARYTGGDPDRVYYGMALKCSHISGSLQCDDRYYPSEWKGLTQVQIGYDDYLCKSTISGKECWEWSGLGSPKTATMGLPDLYCNSSGICDDSGYPSRY